MGATGARTVSVQRPGPPEVDQPTALRENRRWDVFGRRARARDGAARGASDGAASGGGGASGSAASTGARAGARRPPAPPPHPPTHFYIVD